MAQLRKLKQEYKVELKDNLKLIRSQLQSTKTEKQCQKWHASLSTTKTIVKQGRSIKSLLLIRVKKFKSHLT